MLNDEEGDMKEKMSRKVMRECLIADIEMEKWAVDFGSGVGLIGLR